MARRVRQHNLGSMTDPDDLLLSDTERLHALTALGDHYAAGRLDDPEFHSRSGDVAARRVVVAECGERV